MAAYQASLSPDNKYLSVTDQPARKLLKKLSTIDSDFAAAYFRNSCNLEPIKHSDQLRNWFSENKSSFHPLLGQKLTPDNCHVFDLSVSSDEPYAGDLGAKSPEEMEQILARESKFTGIGRYEEPRLCYLGDQFREQDAADESDSSSPAKTQSEVSEPRTIHMGVDLFAPAGTSVFAPYPGKVHSFKDNDIPFDYGPTIILEHDSPAGRFLTLYGHLARTSLNNLKVGQIFQSGELLAQFGSPEENGGWAPHLHFQVMSHDLGLKDNFPGVVRGSELDLWKSIILDPYDLAGVPRETLLPLTPKIEQVKSLREKTLNPSLSLSYSAPLYMVRGTGQYLFDHQGHQYLDCVNNVCHVGHAHPEVANAVGKQLRLLNTNTRYLHHVITEYAERLLDTLPDALDTCFFVNSGSEANDLALRLARNFTGHSEAICVEGAYHGHLTSLIDISPYKYKSSGGKGKPAYVHEIPLPDSYRGVHREAKNDVVDLGRFYADFVQRSIDISASQSTSTSSEKDIDHHQIGAFICESILSCGGQIVLPDGFLKKVYSICRDEEILCIADEVQVGFGRVGEKFWGFELQDVVPDIVTLGKPIGNGFPLAAVVTRREIADAFNNGMEYFNTYGGNPVACTAGLAVLNVIENEGLQKQALSIGNELMKKVRGLQNEFQFIGDVRGKGLFIGIEFVDDPETRSPAAALASYVVHQLKLRGVLLSTDGPDNNIIKIKPPMCFGIDNFNFLVDQMRVVLQEDYPQSFAIGKALL